MGKNNKAKESPSKNSKGGERMDFEEVTVSSKRGRGNSNDDSPSDLDKKPNKISMSITSGNDNGVCSVDGDCDGGKFSPR